jgi:hypothetical protein
VKCGNLAICFSDPDAKLVRIIPNYPAKITANDERVKLTNDEMQLNAFDASSILFSDGHKFDADNGSFFTLKELIGCIITVETLTRGNQNRHWFGGIDCHHVHFEALRGDCQNGFRAFWGS